MLYPRDPSLDPQLVWKGKDEQDARDLAVPRPHLHPGKIHPQAIGDLKVRTPRRGAGGGGRLPVELSSPTSTACPKSLTSVRTSTSTSGTGPTA